MLEPDGRAILTPRHLRHERQNADYGTKGGIDLARAGLGDQRLARSTDQLGQFGQRQSEPFRDLPRRQEMRKTRLCRGRRRRTGWATRSGRPPTKAAAAEG